METEITTEKRILGAAEKEFLEKGYDRAKISTIAKNANVNHAMIHYYFGTKEHLFGIIFRDKVELLAKELANSFDSELNFIEQLDNAIEQHFIFVRNNPNLTLFVLREITTDSGQVKRIHQMLQPKIYKLLAALDKAIDAEVEKGTIRHISAIDLFMNIISLNASSVVAAAIFNRIEEDVKEEEVVEFLEHRKRLIKQFVIENISKRDT